MDGGAHLFKIPAGALITEQCCTIPAVLRWSSTPDQSSWGCNIGPTGIGGLLRELLISFSKSLESEIWIRWRDLLFSRHGEFSLVHIMQGWLWKAIQQMQFLELRYMVAPWKFQYLLNEIRALSSSILVELKPTVHSTDDLAVSLATSWSSCSYTWHLMFSFCLS